MNYNIRPRPHIISPKIDRFGYWNEDNVVKENATPFLNLEELKKEERSSEKTARKIQKLILAKCHQKIRRTNRTTEYRECYYDIPSFIPGYPVYDTIAAKNYVGLELIKNGLYVEDLGPSRIYISWKNSDINHHNYQAQAEKMVNKPNVYKIAVSPVDVRSAQKRTTPKIYSDSNKTGEEPQVSMLQYDNQLGDMIPVNSKKVNQFQEDYRQTLNLDSIHHDDHHQDHLSHQSSHRDHSSHQSSRREYKKSSSRSRKSRDEHKYQDRKKERSNYDHRDRYRENMIDLDERYIPSPY